MRERSLSQHVQTRFYRAPEVILLEHEYSHKIDIWSAGCVMIELLMMSKDYKDLGVPINDKVVFRGESCNPLSPPADGNEQKEDQFKIILEALGRLDEQDSSFLTRQH